jgi:branched-chain amino acid transport system permease protein
VTAVVGVLIFLTKLRISPEAAFSMNDWTVFVILIVVIGGIGTIEGPILGTILYFVLREYLADLGAIYLLILGVLSIVIMLWAPKGIWGLVVKRWDLSLFPVGYRVRRGE